MGSRVAEFRIPTGWTKIKLRQKVLEFYDRVVEKDCKELAARLLMYAESRTACLLDGSPPSLGSAWVEVLHYLCVPGASSGLTSDVAGYSYCTMSGCLMREKSRRCFIRVPTEMVAPFDASLRPHMTGDFVFIAKAASQCSRFKHASLQNNMNAVRNQLCAVVGTEPPYDRIAVQMVTDPTVSGSTGAGLPVTVPAQCACPVYRSTYPKVTPQQNTDNSEPSVPPSHHHKPAQFAGTARHNFNLPAC